MVQEDYYVTQNHFVIHSTGGRHSSTRCRWQKTTCSPDKVLGIVSKSKSLSEKFRKSIFIDGVNCSVEKRHTILGLLKDHIFGQMIVAKGTIGQRMLLQRNGIPQARMTLLLLLIYLLCIPAKHQCPSVYGFHRFIRVAFYRRCSAMHTLAMLRI